MDKCTSKSCGCSDTPVVTTATPPTSQLQRTVYRIDNMDCATEEALIRDRLGKLAGIDGLDFSLMQRTLAVKNTLPTLYPLESALARIGMQVWKTNSEGTCITEKNGNSEAVP